MIFTFSDEDEYRDALIREMRNRGWHVQRHEDRFASYIPDLSYAGDGRDGWLEVKFCTRVPVTLSGLRSLTMGQLNWLKQRRMYGGTRCSIAIGTPDGYGYLVPALPKVTLKSRCLLGTSHPDVAHLVTHLCSGREVPSLGIKD
jgi:hypothetical protein